MEGNKTIRIFDGATAIVTGAASGIGQGLVEELAKRGCEVVLADRQIEAAEKVALAINRAGGKATAAELNVVDFSEMEKLVKETVERTGRLDYMFNNAGIAIGGNVSQYSIEDWNQILEVNLHGVINGVQAAYQAMMNQGFGHMVNTASFAGLVPTPGNVAYAATKHALEAVSDSLRMEVRPFGIKVVIIRPGPVATEFNDVGNEMTGDLMARTDPDYRPFYEAAGAGVGKLFTGISVPGPDLIADLIMEAVLSDTPKVVYSKGPFSEEILGQRGRLDDDEFDRFLTDKFGLTGLTV